MVAIVKGKNKTIKNTFKNNKKYEIEDEIKETKTSKIKT